MTWIKTTDRLPEPGERVLVREGQSISICMLEKYNKGLTFGERVQCASRSITSWIATGARSSRINIGCRYPFYHLYLKTQEV